MSCSPLHSYALAVLCPVLLGAGEGARSAPGPRTGEDARPEADASASVPAILAWGDIDGDGRLELAAVSTEGALQLLASADGERFEDVSERVGLAGITDAALALWLDYDADGRLDLFVGGRSEGSQLFRNEGGVFVDMTVGAGLALEGGVQSADWLDHDGDGRADLHVVTAERHELYRGLEDGFFERVELPLAGAAGADGQGGVVVEGAEAGTPPVLVSGDEPGSSGRGSAPRAVDGTGSVRNRVPLGLPPSTGEATPIMPFPAGCASSIRDQANPGTCLQASTIPALGRLYPISTNLFVAVSGDVGVGTTSPGAKFHVAGTARITDTLTLAPAGDVALDVSAGSSIYKGGALFIHTKGTGGNTGVGLGALASGTGSFNTAVGSNALSDNTSGTHNTAIGVIALEGNTTGYNNTAMGSNALRENTTGYNNTATGVTALALNTTGYNNTAAGRSALFNNTTGYNNTATGRAGLYYNTTGSENTATGRSALAFNTTGDENTASGSNALRSNTTGNANTATGTTALQANTTGSFNTANGRTALFSNTTGHHNTAIGRRALTFNTTASYNTATGGYALYANTTGANNTAGGFSALRDNVTGSANTASGYRALSSNTSSENTAHGESALRANTSGNSNTAQGAKALRLNTEGSFNTALGRSALYYNTEGTYNTATGINALSSNTTASRNTAHGAESLRSNTTGADNTASGFMALANTTGSRNIGVGRDAGLNLTTGSDNIDIGNSGVAGESSTIRIGTVGTHTSTFVAGVHSATSSGGIAVFVNGSGQLGTTTSSRRFKEDIADMGERTERLLELRPVVFRYRPEVLPDGSETPLEYGLIAEEVADVFPDLVVHDEEGQPFTVKYHLLSAMLLNELKRLHEHSAEQLEDLRARLAAVEARVAPSALPDDHATFGSTLSRRAR